MDIYLLDILFYKNYNYFKKILDYQTNINGDEITKILKEIISNHVNNCLEIIKLLENNE